MNQIANIRTDKAAKAAVQRGDSTHVYCGRANARYSLPESPFHNPYPIEGKSTLAEHIRVVDAFRTYWYAPERAELRAQALQELPGKTLVCWCHPKPCHCEVIAEFLESPDKPAHMHSRINRPKSLGSMPPKTIGKFEPKELPPKKQDIEE